MSSFLHSGDLGDIIYALPVIKRLGGGKLFLCSRDFTKPMSAERYEAIKPLLLAQPYITGVEQHKGQKVTHDFTGFRVCYDRKQTLTDSQAAYICPQKAPDSRSAWLTAPSPEKHGRAVLARSPRYHNAEWDSIWPDVLKEYPDALFIGLKEEHEAFCQAFGKVEYRRTTTFLEIANLIAGSSIFIGNQSSPYAVAEGLKHRSIQETHPTTRDCIFPRDNAHFITWRREWEKLRRGGQTTILLMLQVCPLDVYQGRDLTQLIADIEPAQRSDVEFAVSWRRDTNAHAVEDILRIARTKFAKVHSMRCQRRGTGWPMGCNDLWQGGMDTMLAMVKDGRTRAEAVLTFEPDCLPLRPDWIDVLKAEWRRARAIGRLIVGHAHNEPKTHINGNAIFAADILRKHPTIGDSDPRTGWDVYAGRLMLSIGVDSNAISQRYRIKEITREEVEAIRKGDTIPALFHGIKTPDGLAHVRAMIADGTFEARLAEPALT